MGLVAQKDFLLATENVPPAPAAQPALRWGVGFPDLRPRVLVGESTKEGRARGASDGGRRSDRGSQLACWLRRLGLLPGKETIPHPTRVVILEFNSPDFLRGTFEKAVVCRHSRVRRTRESPWLSTTPTKSPCGPLAKFITFFAYTSVRCSRNISFSDFTACKRFDEIPSNLLLLVA